MKTSTKGAAAAAAAGVLLLGGAGSLAYWTDAGTVGGNSIASGHLKLGTPDCGAGWTIDGGATYTSQSLVPGDSLTKVCSFVVDASGAHLTADFGVTAPTWHTGSAAELTSEISLSASYTVNGVAVDTSAPVAVADGDTIEATVTADWAYGTVNNGSNVAPSGLQAVLDDITITATQHHAA